MCEVLDRIENKGRIEERNSMSALIQRMFEEHREDDLMKASMNPEYMDALLKEYNLTLTYNAESLG